MEVVDLIDIDRINRIMKKLVWTVINTNEFIDRKSKNHKIIIEFHYNFG